VLFFATEVNRFFLKAECFVYISLFYQTLWYGLGFCIQFKNREK
jgi:hypothetical protein